MTTKTNSDAKAKTGPKVDEETNNIVYQGATLSQIAAIFSMDQRDIKAKVNGQVQPIGTRRGFPIYAIKDMAQYLVSPPYDIDEFIQRMSIADLPPILRKEYWAGLRSRQLYDKEAAELWPTSDVVEMVSTLLKTVRMSMLLAREAVERETELTPRQRQIIVTLIDNTLEETHAAITRQFSKAKSNAGTAEVQSEEDACPEEL